MHIKQDDLWLCDDCLAVAYGDFTGLDYHYSPEEAARRMKDIQAGLARLGPHLVPDGDGESTALEFSRAECDCCGTLLAGRRTKFVTLEPDSVDAEEVRFLPLGSIGPVAAKTAVLVERYLELLASADPGRASVVEGGLLRDLEAELQDHTPPYTNFGPCPSDAADFGVWVDDDAIADAIHDGFLLSVSDLSEVPDDYEGDVIVTNDHGNRSLYCAEKRSPRGERDFRVYWEAV